MTQCRNYLRHFQHFIANSTISTCFLSSGHAGGIYCFNNSLLMPCRRHFLLLSFSALTAGIKSHSIFCAGCLLIHAYIVPVMTSCRKYFLFFQYFTACRTMSSFCLSFSFTAWIHSYICYFCMTFCFNCAFFGSSTSAAGKSLLSIFCAGYFLSCFSFIPCMAKCRNI